MAGEGPPFVWAHALLASMAADDRAGTFDWRDIGCRLIRYDARSHGRSTFDRHAQHHRWPALAEDMAAVADQASAPAAVFGGASMGAATALWAAHHGFDDRELGAAQRAALSVAFCDDATRVALLPRLKDAWPE